MSYRFSSLASLLLLAACVQPSDMPMEVRPGDWPDQASPVRETVYSCDSNAHFHVKSHGITNPDGEMVHFHHDGKTLTYIAPTPNGRWQSLPADPQAPALTLTANQMVLRKAFDGDVLENCKLYRR